jgi:hypothetical protein
MLRVFALTFAGRELDEIAAVVLDDRDVRVISSTTNGLVS